MNGIDSSESVPASVKHAVRGCLTPSAPHLDLAPAVRSGRTEVPAGVGLALALLLLAPRRCRPTGRAARWPPPRRDGRRSARASRRSRGAARSRVARVQKDRDFPGRRHVRYDQRVGGVRVFGAAARAASSTSDGRTLSGLRAAIDGTLALDVGRPPASSAAQAERAALAASPRGALALARSRAGGAAAHGSAAARLDAVRARCDLGARARLRRRAQRRPGPIATPTCRRTPPSGPARASGATARRVSADDERRPATWRTTGCARPRSSPTTWATTRTLTALVLEHRAASTRRTIARDSGQHLERRRRGGRPRLRGLHLRLLLQAPRPPRDRRPRHPDRAASCTRCRRTFQLRERLLRPLHEQHVSTATATRRPAPARARSTSSRTSSPTASPTSAGTGSTRASRARSTRRSPTSWARARSSSSQPAGNGRHAGRLLPGRGPRLPSSTRRGTARALDGEPGPLLPRRRSAAIPTTTAKRYRGCSDNGGVHINSGIANQAFYLMVEGGTNRTSGQRVAGLGGGGREKAERIFYRGFTSYLTPSATFRDARAATLRAARELVQRGRGGAGGRGLDRGGRPVTGALALLLAAALAAPVIPFTPRPATEVEGAPAPKPQASRSRSPAASRRFRSSGRLPVTFPLYAETARLDVAQQAKLGPAVEGTLSFRFARQFGVSARGRLVEPRRQRGDRRRPAAPALPRPPPKL